MHNSIAAIATAHGVSSISIIRVSGDAALEIAHKISHLEKITPRYAHLTSLYTAQNDLIDQANTTNQFLADQGVILQELVDTEGDILYSGFSQSLIALGKTRLIVFAESDNGTCMGTHDTQLGGDDLFLNPFSLELIQFQKN